MTSPEQNTLANPNLNLFFDGCEDYGFYLHELKLEEGLSKISRAELTLYSRILIRMDELSRLIGKNAAVKLEQTLERQERKQNVVRWFSGLITEVRHLGVAHDNRNEKTFACRLVIESPLINLCYTCRSRSYCSSSPQDILAAIAEEYGITLKVEESVLANVPGFRTASDFFQSNESDYSFLLRLLAVFGLSYNFHSAALPEGASPQLPVLCISDGSVYRPASDLTPEPENGCFDFLCSKSDEYSAAYCMSSWEMCSRIGVDYVRIDLQSPGRPLTGEAGDPSASRRCVLNYSPFGSPDGSDISEVTEHYLHSLDLNKSQWQGETVFLGAMPGVSINLRDFYGTGSADVLKTLVASSSLHFTAPWPTSLLGSVEQVPAALSIHLECMELKSDLLFTTQLRSSEKQLLSAGVSDPDGGEGVVSRSPRLQQAVVCDAGGKTEPGTDGGLNASVQLKQDSNGNEYYLFDAKLVSSGEIVNVWLVMPLGGSGQGLFRVPRQGDSILIIPSGTDKYYYLLGYLPNQNMPFVENLSPQANNFNLNEMTVLRQNVPGRKPEYLGSHTEQVNGKNVTMIDYLPAIRSGSNQNSFSEIGMYSGFSKSDADTTTEVAPMLNLGSCGTMQLTANDNVYTNGKNIKFTCPGWKKNAKNGWNTENGVIDMSDFNTLQVTAAHKIVFKVGSNSISITPNGIAIRAVKWSESGGPMDSAIYMDSISGVSISGMRCSMNGILSASMSDAIGAAVKVGAGAASMTGGVIKMGTADKTDMVIGTGYLMAQFAAQLISFDFKSETADNWIYGVENIVDAGLDAKDFIADCISFYKADNKKAKTPEILISALNMCATLITLVYLSADAWCSTDWLNQPAAGNEKKGNVTNRDAIRLSAFCASAAAWGIAVVPLLAKMRTGQSSTIKLSTDEIAMDVDKIQSLTKQLADMNTVMAGQFADVTNRVSSVEDQVSSVGDRVSSVEDRLDYMDGSIDDTTLALREMFGNQ